MFTRNLLPIAASIHLNKMSKAAYEWSVGPRSGQPPFHVFIRALKPLTACSGAIQ